MQRWLKVTTFIAAVLTTSLVISQVEKKLQTERFPQFDNADVKVWKTVIQPNQPLSMHRHDHPRVIIALTGGTVNIVSPNGAVAEPQHVCMGDQQSLLAFPAMPPNTLHSDVRQQGGEAGVIEVMVVELQKEN